MVDRTTRSRSAEPRPLMRRKLPCSPASSAILRRIQPASQNAIFVGDSEKDGVVGWLHVSKEPLLESEMRAEVNGLVVAEGQRSLGAGAQLLAAAEEWARRHGCKEMSVRSNVIRERAHKFYERQGYEHYKTQKSFRKPL
jgi:GNAT superfamily N-acetyltransferase